ncbi:MAG: LAGLIDADG family homing endonuclease [Thermoplasmata archaeon]
MGHKSQTKYWNQHVISEEDRKLTSDKCYIIGVLCGDGWISTKKNNIQLEVKDGEFSEKFRFAVLCQYGKDGVIRETKRGTYAYQIKSVEIVDDLIYWMGSAPVCESWKVPDCIFGAPRSSRAAFLSGLFDSDGTVGVKARQVHAVDGICLEGLQSAGQLLTTLGIESRLYRLGVTKAGNAHYSLTVSRGRNIMRFVKRIVTSIPRKMDVLTTLCKFYMDRLSSR